MGFVIEQHISIYRNLALISHFIYPIEKVALSLVPDIKLRW